MNDSDLQLLQNYARNNSQDSFATLVCRHLNLVFSAALRQVRSPQLAEDVAQSVFSDLAQSVAKLKPDTILTAWLYEVTRRTAIDVVRRESRRQLREKIAHELTVMNATADDWKDIEPFLDEAMHTLDETDRAAVLLRYFENKTLREVGETLGTSDDAAQKRVSRAVERLREFFIKRGVTVGASGLMVVISANAVQAAPIGLAVTISTAAALAGTSIATTTATITKIIVMTTLQKTIIGATLAVAVGTGIYQTQKNSKLRNANESLQQQMAQLKTENESLSKPPTVAMIESSPGASLRGDQFSELLRLRGEVGVLRRQKSELETSLASVRKSPAEDAKPPAEQPPPPALPEDYPKTAAAATKGIFDTFARGDWDAFFTNFGEPGVPRESYDQMFNDETKSALAELEVISTGQPTNGFGPNHWFVPYKIRFKNGGEKTFRLSVKQDPKTQRFYFDGGL